ncbi:MAG TPA: PIN domain-containing protein, partial [Burkholderiales bacterium]|nr:PIN domain-containing protein [Burkholderiales bacterium]
GGHDIVIDEPCAAELERVLGYALGKWSLDPAGRAACAAACRRLARAVPHAPREPRALPRCADPDDQKFLELAAAAAADALVTKDAALLRLRARLPFRVVTPGEL